WPKLLAIAIVLVLWQLVYLADWHGTSSNGIMKGPVQTLPVLWHDLQHGQLWGAIGITLRSALIGYTAALVIGSLVGAVVSRIKPLRAAVGSIITGLQTMPSIAWFPFAIIFFGLSNATILFVVILGAAPSIANGLIAGVDYTPPLLLRAGKVLGLKRVALYRHLILPASLPSFIAGMKQGWAFAWRSLMAGELLVLLGTFSLGRLLSTYQDNLDMAGAISIMIVILTIGILVDMGFNQVNGVIRRRWGLVDTGNGT
ncbi:MAG TPA: ABC transporter permease subunit, partial [Streptosporangiaceae bacterium]|nr:ABC transporter permease subunit [Streptosporangiaceae bacterium]